MNVTLTLKQCLFDALVVDAKNQKGDVEMICSNMDGNVLTHSTGEEGEITMMSFYDEERNEVTLFRGEK